MYDSNGDGQIDVAELGDVMRRRYELGFFLSRRELVSI
jgi:hypothetical protein